ncbi:tyrosine-protein phosphatase [Dermacoccaceae bacterium W4C1]
MSSAWIDLDGPVNVRDVGGIPLAGGGSVQPGRLIRSDHLADLSERDVAVLRDERGVSDIVDLRSDVEQRITGPGPLTQTDLTHHHHSFFRDPEAAISDALVLPWHEEDRTSTVQQRTSDHWTDHYLGYLAKRPDSVSGALRVIATAPGATVVHCAAGKDRTGTVVALALTVAGVDEDDIAADYAATAQRIERVVARLSRLPGYAENLAGRPMSDHTPDAATIPRLLGAVRTQYGSVQDWLRAQGWSDAEIDTLAAKLTD